eukprot:IDg6220t1
MRAMASAVIGNKLTIPLNAHFRQYSLEQPANIINSEPPDILQHQPLKKPAVDNHRINPQILPRAHARKRSDIDQVHDCQPPAQFHPDGVQTRLQFDVREADGAQLPAVRRDAVNVRTGEAQAHDLQASDVRACAHQLQKLRARVLDVPSAEPAGRGVQLEVPDRRVALQRARVLERVVAAAQHDLLEVRADGAQNPPQEHVAPRAARVHDQPLRPVRPELRLVYRRHGARGRRRERPAEPQQHVKHALRVHRADPPGAPRAAAQEAHYVLARVQRQRVEVRPRARLPLRRRRHAREIARPLALARRISPHLRAGRRLLGHIDGLAIVCCAADSVIDSRICATAGQTVEIAIVNGALRAGARFSVGIWGMLSLAKRTSLLILEKIVLY